MELNAGFKQINPVKVMINIGACMDIPTGTYIKGVYGEHILNGGLGFFTGVVGMGNTFKSTLMHYMFLTALVRMISSGSKGNTYDTEINIHEWHLQRMVELVQNYNDEELAEFFDSQIWTITDKTLYTGDEYYDHLKEFMETKRKNLEKILIATPFVNRAGKNLLIPTPTFTEVDSFSEFVTKDVIKMQDDNSLGDSGANMVYMRQGQQKNRFLMEMPGAIGGTFNYTLMTAHIGTEFIMDPHKPPPKKLSFLKGDIKIKGVPEKFTFVMHNLWFNMRAKPMINDGTKAPEFPRNTDDDLKGDTDLQAITTINLRGKSGPAGNPMTLVVSQEDGILPTLTEFNYIKTSDRYGLGGNDRNYYLELLPEVALSRSTVRGKIDSNSKLRRAMNITSEMCQINDMWHSVDPDFLKDPKRIYEDIKAKGYDWDMILGMTRGWWAPVGHQGKLFLSTWDILKMAEGTYHPYWLEDDKRTIKAEHQTTLIKALLGMQEAKSSKKKSVKVAETAEAAAV